MFIDEVFILVKRGLKASYTSCNDNEKFFKGKMIFAQHIKSNYAHRERFFVEYDIFSNDRPENRLIKSTILFLQQKTASARNRKDLSLLTMWFDGISCSANYEKDFSQYTKNRNIGEYDTVMKWCNVFLFNRSFTAFAGNEVAYALLFPMEQVIESYVAARLKKKLDREHYSFKTQDRKHHLFDYPARKFSLRPDIVITDKTDASVTVLDTKWKLLSAGSHNYGISQSDMYQMYAYHRKYAAKQVILLYPMSEGVANISGSIGFESVDGAKVNVMFVDLLHIEASIDRVLAVF
jgi:5-methylcytosine-specific restriction enzyme subunit McrC